MTQVVIFKDIPENPLPHSKEGYPLIVTGFCLIILGLISDLLIIYAILRARLVTSDTKFILSICISDFLFTAVEAPFAIYGVTMKSYWLGGRYGCLINCFSLIITVGVTMYSMAAMTINRYLIVIKQVYLTESQVNYILIGIWMSLGIVIGILLGTGFYINNVAVQSSRLVCMLKWWSDDPGAVAAIIAVLVSIIIPAISMIFVYSKIILFYMSAKRKAKQNALATQSKVAAQDSLFGDISPEEKRLIIKSCAICGFYVGGWMPYLCKIVIELSTSTPVSPAFDAFCCLTALLNPIINSIILVMFDYKIQRIVFDLFGITSMPSTFKGKGGNVKQKAGNLVPLVGHDQEKTRNRPGEMDTIKIARS